MNTKQVIELLERGHFTLISGNANLYPALVPNATTDTLRQALETVGYKPVPVVGKYGGEIEQSLLVPGMNMGQATHWAELWGQESVLYTNSAGRNFLKYTNGNNKGQWVKGDGIERIATNEPADNWTRIETDSGHVYFTLHLSF